MNAENNVREVKIGVYGEEASFSHAAALKYAADEDLSVELQHLVEMASLFEALMQGTIDLALLPVINQNGGVVMPAFKAMGEYEFIPTHGVKMAVIQCLIVAPGLAREEITQITSHPQAFKQCKDYLTREFPNAKLVEWNDTASAARDLANGKIPKTSAVLASAQAAKMYNLELMEESVEDNQENFTTFIVLKSKNSQ